jgi:hypothetical protein
MRIEDDLLLSMARGGDRHAMASFAKRWWTPVYRFALNLTASAAQAAVVTEETIFVLLQPGDPLPCAVRIAAYRHALQFSMLRRRWARQPAGRPAKLREALQRLAAPDRAALLLRDVELLSVDEVAAVLQISPGEARSRAHRGRLLLMDLTAEGVDGDLPRVG